MNGPGLESYARGDATFNQPAGDCREFLGDGTIDQQVESPRVFAVERMQASCHLLVNPYTLRMSQLRTSRTPSRTTIGSV